MARNDLERLLNELKNISQAKLTTKLAAIDAEKNDGLTMTPIPNEAYFFQDLSLESAAAFPAFMFFGVDDPEPIGNGPGTIERVEIYFIVVVQAEANASQFSTKLLRYNRALKEIFEESYGAIPWATKLQVSSLTPTTLQAPGFQAGFKGVGVKIVTSIG